MPRFIPRPVFLIIAVSLLLLVVVVTGYWFVTGTGVYRFAFQELGPTAGNAGLSLLVTLLANLVVVLIIVFILRVFTRDLPPLGVQLREDVAVLQTSDSLSEQLARGREQQQERWGGPGPAGQLSQKIVSLGILVSGLLLGLVGLAAIWATGGTIYGFQVVLVLVGAGLFIGGGVSFLRGLKSA